eukprot:127056-Prymnesium_polylepis.1
MSINLRTAGAALVAGAALIALRRRLLPLACPTRLEAPLRYYRGCKEWRRIRSTRPAHPSVAVAIRARKAAASERFRECYAECRCGALRVVSSTAHDGGSFLLADERPSLCRQTVREGGPLFTALCHCGTSGRHSNSRQQRVAFA